MINTYCHILKAVPYTPIITLPTVKLISMKQNGKKGMQKRFTIIFTHNNVVDLMFRYIFYVNTFLFLKT